MTEQTTAIVTGGSRGIGRACALALAARGHFVHLTYVSRPEEAQDTCRAIEAAGGQALATRLDVSDRAQVRAFFAQAAQDRRLAVLVNNAGITKDALIIRLKDEDWDRVIDVNLTAVFTCLQEAAKIMMKARSGRIINITSVVGQSGNAGQANYSSAKAGIIGLTKSAALELASRNITVNAVAPGYIETDMTSGLPDKAKESFVGRIPLGRPGTAGDVAAAVAFLASDEAGYITGQVLAINGGMYM